MKVCIDSHHQHTYHTHTHTRKSNPAHRDTNIYRAFKLWNPEMDEDKKMRQDKNFSMTHSSPFAIRAPHSFHSPVTRRQIIEGCAERNADHCFALYAPHQFLHCYALLEKNIYKSKKTHVHARKREEYE